MLLYRRNQILFILSTLIFLSLSTTTTITDDDKWKTLTEWAKKHGAYIHPSIEYYKGNQGPGGMYATQPIAQNELLVVIPQNLSFSCPTCSVMEFTTKLIQERANTNSFWSPYLTWLPTECQNPLCATTMDKSELTRKGYKYIQDNQYLLTSIPQAPISNETSIILSRAWSQNHDLYPIVGAFNHNCNGNLIESTPLFEKLYSSKSFLKGEQIFNDYGNSPILSKYLYYGFVENKKPNCNDIQHLRNIGTEAQRVACLSASYSSIEQMILEMSESLQQNDTATMKGAAQYINKHATATQYKNILFIGGSIERQMIDSILKNNTLQCYINTDKIKHCQLTNEQQTALLFLFYDYSAISAIYNNDNTFNHYPWSEDFRTTLRLLVRDLNVDSVWLGLNFMAMKPLYQHQKQNIAAFRSYFLTWLNNIEQLIVAQRFGCVFWYGNNHLQQFNQMGKEIARNRSWILVEVGSGEHAPTQTTFVEVMGSIDKDIVSDAKTDAKLQAGTCGADAGTAEKTSTISVSITGFGKISVDSSQEPADVVEEFAYRAVAKGRHIGFEEMKQLMEYFCTR